MIIHYAVFFIIFPMYYDSEMIKSFIGFQYSSEHNLPDSPFASPKASGDYFTAFPNDSFDTENNNVGSQPSNTSTNNLITGSSLFNGTPSIDMAPFKSCYFQAPRYYCLLVILART